MRRICTLCLLLLTAAGLTGVARADVMWGPVEKAAVAGRVPAAGGAGGGGDRRHRVSAAEIPEEKVRKRP